MSEYELEQQELRLSEFECKLLATIENSKLNPLEKFNNFSRFSKRQVIANFLNRYEIFKRVLNVHGSVIECGVNLGQGLFSWLHFSSILEPYNHSRRVIGFDTFDGFTNIDNDRDAGGIYTDNEKWQNFNRRQSYEEIVASCETQNGNRPIESFPKVACVKGDACDTIPQFVGQNPHLLVSLLHLDFDVYPPTKVALEHLVPRMPKGAVIAFDELNDANGPGETLAYLESLDIKKYRLERNSFDSNLCFLTIDG